MTATTSKRGQGQNYWKARAQKAESAYKAVFDTLLLQPMLITDQLNFVLNFHLTEIQRQAGNLLSFNV